MNGSRGYRIAVSITAGDGRSGGHGTIEIAQLPMRRRMVTAAKRVAIGLGGGLLLLPVPIIHLFGIVFFLGMTGLAAKGLVSAQVLAGAEGSCPSCGATGALYVGMGGRRVRFPVASTCPKCNVALELSVETGRGARSGVSSAP